jgi:NADPH:quinone reductase-like Zn-dependent oxidoreductase
MKWKGTYYRDRRAGTFQEYVVCPQHAVLHLPPALSFAAGACLGVPGITAAMTLWKFLNVPMPTETSTADLHISHREYVLIWGGSAITGQFAIQLALQSGLSVIAVTSSKTAPLARRLGATNVVSRDGRTNDEIVAEIREIVGDDLTMAIDIVGNDTAAACLKALSTTKPALLAPLAFLKANQEVPENIAIPDIEMKRFVIEQGNKGYAETLNRLIIEGEVGIPMIDVLSGGLGKVEEGLEMLKRGDMGGRKMIVTIS